MNNHTAKTKHGPVGRMMVEITDLKDKIEELSDQLYSSTKESINRGRTLESLGREVIALRDENQKLTEEIEKMRSLLLQGAGTLEHIR